MVWFGLVLNHRWFGQVWGKEQNGGAVGWGGLNARYRKLVWGSFGLVSRVETITRLSGTFDIVIGLLLEESFEIIN